MKIADIVEIVPKSLWSVQFEGEGQNEFDRIFELWGDIEYVNDFFEANRSDLETGYYDFCPVSQAVKITLDDAASFEEKLLLAANEMGRVGTLGNIFKPLDRIPVLKIALEKSKAYGGKRNWLRIYAIRVAMGVYVITGGAIKLTEKMKDRPHTQLEADKANFVREFLRKQGIESDEDFGYLEFD